MSNHYYNAYALAPKATDITEDNIHEKARIVEVDTWEAEGKPAASKIPCNMESENPVIWVKIQ
jgi:hypothetical protein